MWGVDGQQPGSMGGIYVRVLCTEVHVRVLCREVHVRVALYSLSLAICQSRLQGRASSARRRQALHHRSVNEGRLSNALDVVV